MINDYLFCSDDGDEISVYEAKSDMIGIDVRPDGAIISSAQARGIAAALIAIADHVERVAKEAKP